MKIIFFSARSPKCGRVSWTGDRAFRRAKKEGVAVQLERRLGKPGRCFGSDTASRRFVLDSAIRKSSVRVSCPRATQDLTNFFELKTRGT
jgi:hypothetical protein